MLEVAAAMGGVTRCEKHGPTVPIVWVCEHVSFQIEAGDTPIGHRLHACILLMVCPHCFKAGGFDEVAKLPGPPFPREQYRELTKEARSEYDDWQIMMLERVEAPYETLKNPVTYCEECFEALAPKDLTDAPG